MKRIINMILKSIGEIPNLTIMDVAKVSSQSDEMAHDAVLVPPLNFAMVAPGVYRSGYPNKKNFPFLRKLGLKSIM